MTSATQLIRRRRARKARRSAVRSRTRMWTNLGIVALLLVIGVPLASFFGVAAYVYTQAIRGMPTPAQTTFISAAIGPTRLYDRTGNTLLYTVQDPLGDDRQWVSLADLPPYVADATLLVEDPDYLQTGGFDLTGALGRLWRNILFGPIEADATLAGRLVRNVMLPQRETVTAGRRNREIALVAEVNRLYTPSEVLEWHLNTNYYGGEAYGIEAAAQVYLGKSARDLTLAEAAMLASIPTAPQFNPIDDENAARGRQADTLRRLAAAGLITETAYGDAVRAFVTIQANVGGAPEVAPDFAIYARRQAEHILDSLDLDGGRMVAREGLRITTTLDLDLYYQSECALRVHLETLAAGVAEENPRALDNAPCLSAGLIPPGLADAGGANPPDMGSVVVMDVPTGEVLAMIGAANRALYQPGPTLYPFVYFEGFRQPQFTPAAMVLDIPQSFPGAVEGLIYQPANLDNRYSGPLTAREAAAIGLLPPAVEIANNYGLSDVLRSARNLGLNSPPEGLYDLALLDHGGNAALLDIAYAYSVLSTMGDIHGIPVEPRGVFYRTRDPAAVLRIQSADGAVLWEYAAPETRVNVFSDTRELGYLVNDVLADSDVRSQKFGADNPLNPGRPAAVVNGLTSDRIDNWTVGYTPQRVVGVHLGRSDNRPLSLTGYGMGGAAAVWNALLKYSHQRDGLPPLEWERPPRIVELNVCSISGLLPHEGCETRRDVFFEPLAPKQTDTFWQLIEVNNRNNRRATANTPPEFREQRAYFVPPPSARDWWESNGQPLPPDETEIDFMTSSGSGDLDCNWDIVSPRPLAFVRGVVEIRGGITCATLDSFQLSYGADVNPQAWNLIGAAQTAAPPDGVFGRWDTAGLDGIYTLELAVVRIGNQRSQTRIQVFVDNAAPTLVLTAGEAGKVYRWPEEQVVPLRAQVEDNFSVARVEFYRNGELIFTDTEAPFEYDYFITRTGNEVFSAVAHDSAGNQNQSLDMPVEIAR